jgi:hypothetical protein
MVYNFPLSELRIHSLNVEVQCALLHTVVAPNMLHNCNSTSQDNSRQMKAVLSNGPKEEKWKEPEADNFSEAKP